MYVEVNGSIIQLDSENGLQITILNEENEILGPLKIYLKNPLTITNSPTHLNAITITNYVKTIPENSIQVDVINPNRSTITLVGN